ncbi:putative transcription initiation factor TFIID subunit 9 [Triangularia verruculosa]|uniref:Transcription initiation factor TFIID subunit 9 n=1 Tax=Triangularia verruculosa TaxID=2587418 RepID=A0AAN7AWT0_9PEZI|nr:putative transcription initiation factor TFIID subunit 9 [Triangularia verruculosa]
MATAGPQPNGNPPTQQSQSTSQTLSAPSQNNTQSQQQQPPPPPALATHNKNQPPNPTAPRPRESRTLELLLTAQGVSSYEPRVPLLLLDFAYRHTSSVLSDALQLSADPYTSHAGSRPSASSGAAPVNVGDAAITANAVSLAIASRLAYQFRGGNTAGASKDWLLDMAKERNKTALPRVPPSEWGLRLPGEKFVLSGTGWGLRDVWAGQEAMEESGESEEEEGDEEMEDVVLGGQGGGQEKEEDVGGDGVEGGTMGDVFGDDAGEEDEEMAEA